jgi:hypothetical protein
MLDTVRVYAAERLSERGEEQACLARLDNYLRDFVRIAGPKLMGRENHDWADRVDRELNDLRQAMTRAVQADDSQTIIALTAPLFTYWWSHGLLSEMRELAEQAAALPSASRLAPEATALLGWARGMFRVSVGQNDEAQPLLSEVVAVTNTGATAQLHAYAVVGLGLTYATGNAGETKKLLDEAISAFVGFDDRWNLAFALSVRGQLALLDGDPGCRDDAAQRRARRSRADSERLPTCPTP